MGDPSFPAPGRRAGEQPPADATWRKVVVPENFGFDDELSRQFAPVWYRRTFADPRSDDEHALRRVRLRFGAVDYLADVWLNDEHLGHHEGCFAPFGFDVTDRLRRSNNIVVAVQDPLEDLDPAQFFFFHRKRVIKGTLNYHDSRPGGLPGRMLTPLAEGEDPWVWTPELGQSMTTGGIVQPVTLECSGDVSIDGCFVTPVDDAGGAQVAVVMTNHATEPRDVAVHVDIGGLRGRGYRRSASGRVTCRCRDRSRLVGVVGAHPFGARHTRRPRSDGGGLERGPRARPAHDSFRAANGARRERRSRPRATPRAE